MRSPQLLYLFKYVFKDHYPVFLFFVFNVWLSSLCSHSGCYIFHIHLLSRQEVKSGWGAQRQRLKRHVLKLFSSTAATCISMVKTVSQVKSKKQVSLGKYFGLICTRVRKWVLSKYATVSGLTSVAQSGSH